MTFRFQIDHLDHDGLLIETIDPVDLRWDYRIREKGTIWYKVALSDPLLTRDQIAPRRTDWQLNLLVDEIDSFPLMAGIHTAVNMKSEEGVIEVYGADWLEWLDQPYPFPDTGGGYEVSLATHLADTSTTEWWAKLWSGAAGKTQQDVVSDLIFSLSDPAYGTDPVLLVPAFNGPAWTQTADYSIYYGDSTSVLDHLRAISGLYDPRGFDFWAEWDKTIRLEGPRLINPAAVTPAYSFISEAQIVDFDWTNRGPRATDVVGLGSGSGNVRGYDRKTFQASVDLYRKWLLLINFQSPSTDLTGANMIADLVDQGEYLEPQKELAMTVKPDAVDPADETAFFFSQIGEAVDVDYDQAPYHRIDAFFYVTGQSFRSDPEGNWLCDLTLEQVY